MNAKLSILDACGSQLASPIRFLNTCSDLGGLFLPVFQVFLGWSRILKNWFILGQKQIVPDIFLSAS